jgi:transposase
MPKNVADALEQVLGRERQALKQAARCAWPEPALAPRPPSQNERLKAQSRARRLARCERLQALLAEHPEDMTCREIAQAAGVSLTTFYQWQRMSAFPERKPLPRRPRLVDPFLPYLLRRWGEGCQDVARLWNEIVARGFPGTQGMVGYALRDQCAALKAHRARERLPVPSPRQALWLLLTPQEKREEKDQRFAAELGRLSPAVQAAQDLARAFFALVRGRDAGGLEPWLSGALQSAVPEMASCASGMRKDEAAVAAGLSSPWSNGQPGATDKSRGKSTGSSSSSGRSPAVRVPGRANFDLLRARVLPLQPA